MKYTTPVMKICGQPSQLHWHLSKNHPLLPPPPAPLVPLATPAVAVWCLLYVLHVHWKPFPHFFGISSFESWNKRWNNIEMASTVISSERKRKSSKPFKMRHVEIKV